MRIADNQVIAGLPAITARQMMRRLGEYITPSLVQQIIAVGFTVPRRLWLNWKRKDTSPRLGHIGSRP